MVHVITSPSLADKMLQNLPDYVGLMVLNGRHNISTLRGAQSRKAFVDPGIIFDCLRKEEYTALIRDYYGCIPEVPNTQLYRACRELFCRLAPGDAHDGMVKMLKKRGSCKAFREFIETSPEYLRAYALNSGLSKREYPAFMEMLNMECGKLIKEA